MSDARFLTLSEAVTLAGDYGVTWTLCVRSTVEERPVRVSIVGADPDADVTLKIGNHDDVLLGTPNRSGPDTCDFLHAEAVYASEFTLVVVKDGARAEVVLLPAAQTFNRVFGAWTSLDEMLLDRERSTEAGVDRREFLKALDGMRTSPPAITHNFEPP